VIEVRNLVKNFDGLEALKDINLTINDGDIISLIGPSGSGKSTLCRCIHGLETPDGGEILLDGEVMDHKNKAKFLEQRKKMGFVFQHFNLFNNKTVIQNCMLAQTITLGKSAQEAEKTAMEYLTRVGLADKRDAYPSKLSGGQKQRVAIARALVNDPKILLSDEATSALDPKITRDILDLLQKINRELGITVVVVTHQMEVVKQICQRVAFLKHGVVLAEGKPEDLFVRPNEDIKAFLGTDSGVLPEDGVNIQLFFSDESADEPVITMMARELGIDFSICWGKLEDFRSNVYGSLVINVKDKDETDVIAYLTAHRITWEVL